MHLSRDTLNKSLLCLLSILPLGLFTLKGWASGLSFACAALAILVISSRSLNPKVNEQDAFWIQLLLLMFTLPLFSVMLSSALRGEWIWANFDSASRFFIAAPIFYTVLKNQLKPLLYLQYLIPISLILTIVAIPLLPYYGWEFNRAIWGDRSATYFVDPLTLGYLSLTLGMLCFFSINMYSKDSWFIIILKIVGAIVGFYISLKTQSRTGWLAIPLALFLLLWLHGPKNKILSTSAALIISLLLTLGIYQLSSTVQSRVHAGLVDLQDYKVDQVNSESSIGERISFARMGFHYFKLSPLYGWGLRGYMVHANDPELLVFASESTRASPGRGSLFHSEFTTNAVAYGLLGIIYTLLIFFGPLTLCIRQWARGVNPRLCAFGIIYLLCEIVSGLSTEIFGLKFAASFHAVFLACLCAELLLNQPQQQVRAV
jgi:O-antigen ligase